ncbi:MAG: hypothetical protein ACRYFU_08795 [Janthinobacterium lividum]
MKETKEYLAGPVLGYVAETVFHFQRHATEWSDRQLEFDQSARLAVLDDIVMIMTMNRRDRVGFLNAVLPAALAVPVDEFVLVIAKGLAYIALYGDRLPIPYAGDLEKLVRDRTMLMVNDGTEQGRPSICYAQFVKDRTSA